MRTDQIVGMCQGAQVVYGVGPHLSEYWQDRLGRPVHQIVPGLDTTGRPVTGPPPGEQRVLLLGRMEDRQIKGVDIAATAYAHLPRSARDGTRFVVMGTPEGTEAQLAQTLHQEYGVPEKQIQVKEYSSDPQDVVRQLRKASVLVMPSRAEGYGLVAHEAVSLGVPALVSDRSGFGQLLARDAPAGSPLVIPVTGNLDRDQDRWAHALAGALQDPAGHFDQARTVRDRLATWPQVAQDWTDSIHQARTGRTASLPGPHPSRLADLGPTAPAPGARPAQPSVPQPPGGPPVGTGHGTGQAPPSIDLPVGMQHLGGAAAQERGRAAFQPGAGRSTGQGATRAPTAPRQPGTRRHPGHDR